MLIGSNSVAPGSDISLITNIGDTPPTGWEFTGSSSGTTSNGTNTSIAVTLGNTQVSDLNFGLVQPPVANDDSSFGNSNGSNVTINILTNDLISDGSPATPSNSTVQFSTAGLPLGSTIVGNTITVPGEGIYTNDPLTGNLTFDPDLTFTGNPTLLSYSLTDVVTGLSDPALVTITYLPLPVTLISFSATLTEGASQLAWQTTEEINASHFEVQRSSNAKQWQRIGEVKTDGESNTLRSYDFIDIQPYQGDNYYRLKMVDQDGSFTYSSIQHLVLGRPAGIATLYPNPSSDHIYIQTTGKVKTIALTDLNGKTLYTGQYPAAGISLKSFAVGLYVVKIQYMDGTVSFHKAMVAH